MDIKLPFGLKNGKLVHIEDLDKKKERGKKCNCICPSCKSPLIAKMGKEKAHHFAHMNENCEYGVETALHLFAKEVFEKNKKIKLPPVLVPIPPPIERYNYDFLLKQHKKVLHKERSITFDKVLVEKRISNIIPDIILIKDGRNLLVEIKVSHGVDDVKLEKIRKLGYSVIEIDVKSLLENETKSITLEKKKIADILINSSKYKEWLYNIKAKKEQEKLKKQINSQKTEEEMRTQNEQKKLLNKRERIKTILSPNYQIKMKKIWEKELLHNKEWIRLSNEMHITLDNIPPYLNKEIEGEEVFACDRRLWQTHIFRVYIFNRHSRKYNKAKTNLVQIKGIINYLKIKQVLPLNKDLIYTKDIYNHLFYKCPDLSTVLDAFFLNLQNYGFVKITNSSISNGSPAYYCWFEIIEDKIKYLPSKYNTQKYYEDDNYLLNKETGEFEGYLKDIYQPNNQ